MSVFRPAAFAAIALTSVCAVIGVTSCQLYKDEEEGTTEKVAESNLDGVNTLKKMFVPDTKALLYYDNNGAADSGTSAKSAAPDWKYIEPDGSNFVTPAFKNYKLYLPPERDSIYIAAVPDSAFARASFSMGGQNFETGAISGVEKEGVVITVTVTAENRSTNSYSITVTFDNEGLPPVQSQNDLGGADIDELYAPDGFGVLYYYKNETEGWVEKEKSEHNDKNKYRLELNIGKETGIVIVKPADSNAAITFSMNGNNIQQGVFTNIPAQDGSAAITITGANGTSFNFDIEFDRSVLDAKDFGGADFDDILTADEEDQFEAQKKAFAAVESYFGQITGAAGSTKDNPFTLKARNFDLTNPGEFAAYAIFRTGSKYLNLDLSGSIVGTPIIGSSPAEFCFSSAAGLNGVRKIVSLTLPQSVTQLKVITDGTLDDYGAEDAGVFTAYTYLKKLNAPGAKVIGKYAFDGCFNLEELKLPAAANLGASAFASCFSLKEITFGSTAPQTIGDNIFDNLTASDLQKIKVYTSSANLTNYWGGNSSKIVSSAATSNTLNDLTLEHR
ncbi:MAG: leucine-rich repeat protein [Spirochaetaceae bacterium]|jgi:hypothetical protein|nr:leucine-rich repeat protein [Spirochaetaceae bacterium]